MKRKIEVFEKGTRYSRHAAVSSPEVRLPPIK